MKITKYILQAALLSATALTLGCASSNDGAVTPLGSADLNHNWTFNSAATPNPPAILAFAGPMTNDVAPTHYDTTFHLPITANLTITPTAGHSACFSQAIALTGSLVNPVGGEVDLSLTGPVAEGTITISGNYFFNKQVILGTYAINGGPCNIGPTQFSAGITGAPAP